MSSTANGSLPIYGQPNVPSVLLPEILGFVPQYLLDDIVNIANEASQQTVDAMEAFLLNWAEAHHQSKDTDPSTSSIDLKVAQEIEQGLVAFQTLLESHVDLAFDLFEVWSLRNIFSIPADLPIVAPHQAGLDLTHTGDEESQLLAEIDELRRKISAQRRLRRLYTRAVRQSAADLTASRTRLDRLSFLRSPHLQTLLALPDSFLSMYTAVSSLPPLEPPPLRPGGTEAAEVEQGKRPWEMSKSAYLNWAVEQMIARARDGDRSEVQVAEGETGAAFSEAGPVARTVEAAHKVASVDGLKAALAGVSGERRSSEREHSETMDTS